ncbi:MAG: membrane protein insertion efficiency factor YidD [Pelagibacterales bacterium]|nr:membrane protein insertion efficiency factor YidD [Pelagibacterales bacterium]
MKIITYLLIGIIKLYKLFISPLFPNSCKFEPTCSSYCIDALETYGLIKGIAKSISRIARCNPWFNTGGYDPAVKQEKEIK